MLEHFLIFLVPASRDQLDEEVEEERRCEYNAHGPQPHGPKQECNKS
jgi:hypothetical protein